MGKRYDVVSAFRPHAFTVAADPSPLAPARYAADRWVAPPRFDDPAYIPFLAEVVERYDVRAVVPLTDLDPEILAGSDLPAFVPAPEVCRIAVDKYQAHQRLLELDEHGKPTGRDVAPGGPAPPDAEEG